MKKYPTLLILLLTLALNSSAQKGPCRFPVDSASLKYRYINRDGLFAFPKVFSAAGIFVDNRAAVRTNDENEKWGYIDTNGRYVIPPVYTTATTFSEGIAFVSKQPEVYQAINEKGKVLFTLKASGVYNFHDGLAAFFVDAPPAPSGFVDAQLWGFIDKNGKVVIKPKYYFVHAFSDGFCAVMNPECRWGYINKKGKLVINYQYIEADDFQYGMASVGTFDGDAVIDTNGQYILQPTNRKSREVDGNMIRTSSDTSHGKDWRSYAGWINRNGKIVIPFKYLSAGLFNGNKYALLCYGDECGYINKKGDIVIKPKFNKAYNWDGDIALAPDGPTIIRLDTVIKSPTNYKIAISYRAAKDNNYNVPRNTHKDLYYNHIAYQGAYIVAKKYLQAYQEKDYDKMIKYLIQPDDISTCAEMGENHKKIKSTKATTSFTYFFKDVQDSHDCSSDNDHVVIHYFWYNRPYPKRQPKYIQVYMNHIWVAKKYGKWWIYGGPM